MVQRRDVLRWSLSGVAGVAAFCWNKALFAQDKPDQGKAGQAPAPAPSPPPQIAGPGVLLAPPVDFQPGSVWDNARALSKQPFKPVSFDLPDPFRTLSYDQYVGISLKPEARIWGSENIGFAIEPLHRGFQFNNAIQLNLVADGKAQRLVYDTKLFDLGKLNPTKIGDLGFSGFRVLSRQEKDGYGTIATVQGANFFHAMANGQVEGLMARALALKIADPNGEEMPAFRSIWIEKPSIIAATLVVYALVDSESVTGAFRFTIRPGDATIIDTECTLFPRANVDNFGVATMSATHLLGFMDHKKFNDYRPNVSEACGLQMLTGNNEWLWRPVTNRDSLQISTFVDNKPHGFGLLVRNRDFEDYVDADQHWEKRPSLWIEPLSEWAEGGVQLIEIPSQSDANDNILCYWRPKEPLKAGTEVAFAYRQFWCWDPPDRPDLARAMRSRSGSVGKRHRFFVEFEGDVLADEKRTAGIGPTLTAGSGSITMMKTYVDPERKAYRVMFELDPGNAEVSELRMRLEAQGKPVSETWLYRWTNA